MNEELNVTAIRYISLSYLKKKMGKSKLKCDFLKPIAWRFDTSEDVLSSAADDASVFG